MHSPVIPSKGGKFKDIFEKSSCLNNVYNWEDFVIAASYFIC